MESPFPHLDQISTDATRRRIAIDDQAEQARTSANASLFQQAVSEYLGVLASDTAARASNFEAGKSARTADYEREKSTVSSTGRIISPAPWHGDGGEARSSGKVQER